MKKNLLFGLLIFMTATMISSCGGDKELKWTTFEKIADKRGERMIMVELYTSWCGWCRRMEKYTFNDPVVAKYMNKNFYSIRFNAEERRAVEFLDKNYRFNPSDTRRGRHELAAALMMDSEKQGYPTIIFLDKNYNLIQAIPGYITATDFEAIMHYFGDGAYQTTSWPDFVKKYTIGDAKYSTTNSDSTLKPGE